MRNVKSNNSQFEESIFKLINKYQFIKYENSFGVAVSGGPDSMLLLHILSKWANLKKKNLSIFSFNHNIRKDSYKDLMLVEAFTKKLGHEIIKINWHETPNTGIMEKARIARYSLIAEHCKNHKIKTIFLGHHADDIAETVSIRLLKKSSLEGLCPIFEIRELFRIKLFRPFLKINKEQILNLNSTHNINYINDPSNSNKKYLRSRIRSLLQEDKQLKTNLTKASYLFCKIRKYNDKFIKTKFKEFYTFKEEGFLIIDRLILNKYPNFLIITFLKNSIFRIGGKTYFSKPEKLNDLYNKALNKIIFKISLGGCILEFKERYIYIFREYKYIENKIAVLKENCKINWDNRFNITNNSKLEFKVLPIGKVLNNTFYLKNFRLNKKKIKLIPFRARKTLPVIIALEGSIHIPHLNISELNLTKNSIECQTIDFFDKKYDNI